MNPMYAVMKGTAMKDKRKRAGGGGGGGGGTPSISIATSATGNFDNAVKIAFLNNANGSFGYSGGVKDGSNSTFGTASSPTRTTQVIPVAFADYLHENNIAGSGGCSVIIGGYIRTANFTAASFQWTVASNTIQSQSFSSASANASNVTASRIGFQDNTNVSVGGPLGIYDTNIQSASSGFHIIFIQHGGGRGAATLPQVGDTFTFRVQAEATDSAPGKAVYTATHDVTVNFV